MGEKHTRKPVKIKYKNRFEMRLIIVNKNLWERNVILELQD